MAVQRIVEKTVIERIHRAQKSVTTASGQELDYKPGELVDFFRPSGSKDRSGWQYGAKVIENMPNSGQVKIVYKGLEMLVKYGDVRRHMPYASLTLEFATQIGQLSTTHCRLWRGS